jgi:hypothetical protein
LARVSFILTQKAAKADYINGNHAIDGSDETEGIDATVEIDETGFLLIDFRGG